MIYYIYAIAYPYFMLLLSGGNAALIHQDRLFKLQKRAIRIINNHSSFLAHTNPIFYVLNILQYRDVYLLKAGFF